MADRQGSPPGWRHRFWHVRRAGSQPVSVGSHHADDADRDAALGRGAGRRSPQVPRPSPDPDDRPGRPSIVRGEAHRTGDVRRRRGRGLCALAALGLAALALPAVLRSPPLLVWNASPSMPVGLYRVEARAPVAAGDTVVAWLPPTARTLAARRRYLPAAVPAVKRVAALARARVCSRAARARARSGKRAARPYRKRWKAALAAAPPRPPPPRSAAAFSRSIGRCRRPSRRPPKAPRTACSWFFRVPLRRLPRTSRGPRLAFRCRDDRGEGSARQGPV